jgi:predicted helicase
LGWQIADSLSPESEKSQIFEVNVLGFQSHRDHFAIGFDHKEIDDRVRDMLDATLDDKRIEEKYGLKDSGDWKLSAARKTLKENPNWKKYIIACDWRPFDSRVCFFDNAIMDRPRRELIDHVAWRENIQLLIPRQIGSGAWRHALVADAIAESCCISDASSEGNYNFPLWTYAKEGSRSENLTPTFRDFLDARYHHHYTPEEILGYIYAVLHAPTYRARYAEFLRIDFPRIPFPETRPEFDALSVLGLQLVGAHLLRKFPRGSLAVLQNKGNREVEAIRYVAAEQAIFINKTQFFAPVPQAVWDFHIGGYQVLDKYLKSRKGRVLSLDEITHVGAVADSLAFTIEQMAKIDQAYLAAFPDRG